MLIKCPECSLQVSDKASFCPHCGYPMMSKAVYLRPSKRQRLPNGFGQITKLKQKNLRKPYRAMVTVGKTEEGRPISKLLKPTAYFETYNDAYEALLEYNKNPFDLTSQMSVNELFDLFMASYKVTEHRKKVVRSAWKYCWEVHNLDIREIRTRHIKYVLENGTVTIDGVVRRPTKMIQSCIMVAFRSIFDIAIEKELVTKNYAKDVNIKRLETNEETTKFPHTAFTKEEMKIIAEKAPEDNIAEMLLIQCYTGLRPGELISLTAENINLADMVITCGSKTQAGRDRKIPIHKDIASNIFTLVERSLPRKKHNLFAGMKYDKYREGIVMFCENNGMEKHLPHDPRKTFITFAKKCKMDEYVLKRIVGHKIEDLTERVYTERDLIDLHDEMAKISFDV